MVQFIEGEVDLKLPDFVFLANSNKLYLECKTGTDACIINLPSIQSINNRGSWGFWIFINDYDKNAAVNNIAIIAAEGDLINGEQFIILNHNGVSSVLYVVSPTDWSFNNVTKTTQAGGYNTTETIPVISNGQTQFTLSEAPDPSIKTQLIVNSAVQLIQSDYVITDRSLRWVSTSFPLTISDTVQIYY